MHSMHSKKQTKNLFLYILLFHYPYILTFSITYVFSQKIEKEDGPVILHLSKKVMCKGKTQPQSHPIHPLDFQNGMGLRLGNWFSPFFFAFLGWWIPKCFLFFGRKIFGIPVAIKSRYSHNGVTHILQTFTYCSHCLTTTKIKMKKINQNFTVKYLSTTCKRPCGIICWWSSGSERITIFCHTCQSNCWSD